MASFSSEGIGEGGVPGFAVQQPVVDTSPLAAIDGLGKILKVAGGISANKRAAKKSSVVDRFTEEQVTLADAVDQGKMTSLEARTRSRANFLRYSANNPGISDELIGRHKDILSQSGLAKSISEGSVQEQQQAKAESAAVASGWAHASDTLEVKAEKTREHGAFLQAQDKLRAASAEVGFSSASLALQNAQRSAKSTDALFSLSSSFMPKLTRDFGDITDRFEGGEVSLEDATQEINLKWAEVTQILTQVGGRSGGTYLRDLSSPMEQAKNNALSFLKGDSTLSSLRNQNEITLALATQSWLAEPQVASIAAGQKLLHGSDMLSLLGSTGSGVLRKMDGLINDSAIAPNLMPGDVSEEKDVGTIFALLKSNINDLNSGRSVEGVEEQVNSSLGKALDSIEVYQSAASSPKHFNLIVDFLASKEFGSMAVRDGGISPDKAVKAKQVLQAQYEREVIPVLQEEYERQVKATGARSRKSGVSSRVGSVDQPLTQVVIPKFSGTGVFFSIAPGVDKDQQTSLQATIKSLNKKVAPTINRLIRMSAHLEGGKNYKKVYDENYSSIFGVEQEGEVSDE